MIFALLAADSLLGISLVDGKGGASISVPMQITILMTLLLMLPAAIMSVTPFLRISIVLHFLRQALGTQSAPSNQVLVGLSLFLSMLIVSPVLTQIHSEAWEPMQKGAITQDQAIEKAGKPLKTFLAKYAREKDVKLFLEITHAPRRALRTISSSRCWFPPISSPSSRPDSRSARSCSFPSW